jgi:hypothetical protein
LPPGFIPYLFTYPRHGGRDYSADAYGNETSAGLGRSKTANAASPLIEPVIGESASRGILKPEEVSQLFALPVFPENIVQIMIRAGCFQKTKIYDPFKNYALYNSKTKNERLIKQSTGVESR